MRRTLNWCLGLAAVLALAGLAYPTTTYAQSSTQAQAGPSARTPSPITGELVRVSPETKMFTVKSASGVDTEFHYSDQTVVAGAQNTVAGLATMNGDQVTVTFRIEGANNMATKIDVQSKKK